jgi:hypothetical protein
MDLFAAERLNGKLNRAKVWALACFAIAGVLLVASLLMQPPEQHGLATGASPPSHTGSVR